MPTMVGVGLLDDNLGVSIEQRLQVGAWAELDSLGAGAEEQVTLPEGTFVAFAWGKSRLPCSRVTGVKEEGKLCWPARTEMTGAQEGCWASRSWRAELVCLSGASKQRQLACGWKGQLGVRPAHAPEAARVGAWSVCQGSAL